MDEEAFYIFYTTLGGGHGEGFQTTDFVEAPNVELLRNVLDNLRREATVHAVVKGRRVGKLDGQDVKNYKKIIGEQ